ncbi:GHKL domain-containing protein [Xylocopilactobacillus apicola]|uniref:GHKL domain-containing protein n=1 Tax=Xylocopilactobacillus apicola TaxID=2932184 RepID=UPI003CE46FE3
MTRKINVTVECIPEINIEKIDPFNLVRCLGIILDNAIEECKKNDAPEIRIGFFDNSGHTTIIVTNTCADKPEITIGKSSKGKNRGFGLQNLHEFVNQCDNLSLSTSCSNGTFVQKLFIKK